MNYSDPCDRHDVPCCTMCTPRPYRGRATQADEVDRSDFNGKSYGLPWGEHHAWQFDGRSLKPADRRRHDYARPPVGGFDVVPVPTGDWGDALPEDEVVERLSGVVVYVGPELTPDVAATVNERTWRAAYAVTTWTADDSPLTVMCEHGYTGDHDHEDEDTGQVRYCPGPN